MTGGAIEPSIRAPVVAAIGGPGRGDELAALDRVAAELGWQRTGRHRVGSGRLVVELDRLQAHAMPVEPADPTEVVRALRTCGMASIEGPRGPGHQVAWANRNGPHWFRPGQAVCFPWSVFDRDQAQLVIEIDPGAGFGAGSHPTTSLLLRWLTGPDIDLGGRRVLDVGCGTGVLAVAAARSGAATVTACDIAPAALEATAANAARNGVADQVNLVEADLALLTDSFDVVANIHAPVLIDLAPELTRLVGPGGELALSGLSPAQVSTVSAAVRPLERIEQLDAGEWSAAVYAHVHAR